jgi:DNA replication protein DnaC
MGYSGFPKKFLRDDWVAPEFVKKYEPPVKRSEFRDFRGLFLTGPTGRKKTASLCLMVRDWMARVGRKSERAWWFVSFPALCVELQASWSDGGKGPMEIIGDLADVPLLIVDDVGAEKTTDFVLQSAYLLFNKREQNELPIYGTSNLTIEEIGNKLDERIASRIRGMCHVVAVGGEDQRGKS